MSTLNLKSSYTAKEIQPLLVAVNAMRVAQTKYKRAHAHVWRLKADALEKKVDVMLKKLLIKDAGDRQAKLL